MRSRLYRCYRVPRSQLSENRCKPAQIRGKRLNCSDVNSTINRRVLLQNKKITGDIACSNHWTFMQEADAAGTYARSPHQTSPRRYSSKSAKLARVLHQSSRCSGSSSIEYASDAASCSNKQLQITNCSSHTLREKETSPFEPARTAAAPRAERYLPVPCLNA